VLYPAELHEQLTETSWDARHVRDAIRVLAADADSACDTDALWPAHEWDAWQAALPLKNLYAGAAGVAWALGALRQRGLVETALDPAGVARRALDACRREPDFIGGKACPGRSGRASSAARPVRCSSRGFSLRAPSSKTISSRS
jgi:hypothetical protein